MPTEKEKIAADLKAHLQFMQSMGTSAVPRNTPSTGPVAANTPRSEAAARDDVDSITGGTEWGPHFRQQTELRGKTGHAGAEGDAEKWGNSGTGPVMESERGTLAQIRADVGDCQRCKLCSTRKNIVFGVGNPKAELMFIGEGPGADEDEQGEPFVGRAGQLLTKIIEAMGLTRKEVYINNIVMCRPPGNRAPEPDESAACKPFLLRRIAAIRPKLIVCLGATAVKNLLETDTAISKLRGKIQDWNGYKVMPTFHPAFLLRNPPAKKEVWEDMKEVLRILGKPMAKR